MFSIEKKSWTSKYEKFTIRQKFDQLREHFCVYFFKYYLLSYPASR